MVRAFASHQCGLGSNPGVDAICGLSLLLVLYLALRGFSPRTKASPSPTFSNFNSIRNDRRRITLWICCLYTVILILIFLLFFRYGYWILMTIQFSEFLYKSLFFWKAISNDNCCTSLTTPM